MSYSLLHLLVAKPLPRLTDYDRNFQYFTRNAHTLMQIKGAAINT